MGFKKKNCKISAASLNSWAPVYVLEKSKEQLTNKIDPGHFFPNDCLLGLTLFDIPGI